MKTLIGKCENCGEIYGRAVTGTLESIYNDERVHNCGCEPGAYACSELHAKNMLEPCIICGDLYAPNNLIVCNQCNTEPTINDLIKSMNESVNQ